MVLAWWVRERRMRAELTDHSSLRARRSWKKTWISIWREMLSISLVEESKERVSGSRWKRLEAVG